MNHSLCIANLASNLGVRNLGEYEQVKSGGEVLLESLGLEADFETDFEQHNSTNLESITNKYDRATQTLTKQWPESQSLISFGGDHSVGHISLSAVLDRHGADQVGVVMFDSHADLHLPTTSPSGNFHGMWLRSLMPRIKPEQLIYIGNLITEAAETNYLTDNQIQVYSSEADDSSPTKVADWSKNYKHLHISFDIDVLSQSLISATGTPNPNGFSLEQLSPYINNLKKHPSFSLDIVEYNPELDQNRDNLETIKQILFEFLPELK